MSSFSITRKKTPFQKHREEKEAKKKRAEDETARLYEEFLESFQGDDLPGSKAFVRGGTINPNDKAKADSEDMFPHSYHLRWLLKAENLRGRNQEINQRRKRKEG